MALYRTICLSFWTDAKIVDDFTPEDKYFYLYLFTNPHTNLAGCYEVSLKQMVNETGYSKETIEKLIERFSRDHNVLRYSKDTKEILLLNWHKYNWTKSDKVISAITKEVNSIKDNNFRDYLLKILYEEDTVSIPYTYPMDTSVTVTNTITNTITNTDKCFIDYQGIVDMFNNTCISLPKVQKITITRENRIKRRLQNFDVNDLQNAFIKAEKSDFLSGRNGTWKASFDWFFENDSNLTKVLEGNYDNNDKRKSNQTNDFFKALEEA